MSWFSQAVDWVGDKVGDRIRGYDDDAQRIAAEAAAAAARSAANALDRLGNQADAYAQSKQATSAFQEAAGVLGTPLGMGLALGIGYLLLRKDE